MEKCGKKCLPQTLEPHRFGGPEDRDLIPIRRILRSTPVLECEFKPGYGEDNKQM